MLLTRPLLTLTVLAAGMAPAFAEVALASAFSDHLVLQRERPVPVWGTATAGETVTVTCNGIVGTAVAGADGRWKAILPALPTGGPYELTAKGSSTVTLKDVLVGDVWLCSGQSNMEWTTAKAVNGADEVAKSDHPRIRLLQVAKAAKDQPQTSLQGAWQVCGPTSVAGFSAVGYFFGRELEKTLDVPIGLINSSWGGTDAEAWTSQPALEASEEFKAVMPGWEKILADHPKAMEEYTKGPLAKWEKDVAAAKAAGSKDLPRKPREPRGPGTPQHRPAGLYNGMIAPLVPYALRGAIWYQGENNAGMPRAESYRRLMPVLINDWRQAFGSEFPFHIVQLANYNKDDPALLAKPWPVVPWAILRESQLVASRTTPKVGLAVAIDIGNPADIHPTNKQEVGRRLALIALAKDYGKPVAWSGPEFQSMTVSGDTAVLTFAHADGLKAKDGELKGFVIAGEDGMFAPATAVIEGATVKVSSPAVAKPFAVRYNWLNSPEGNLVNAAGLPAGPFRFPMQ